MVGCRVEKATLPNPDTDATEFVFTGKVGATLENGESSQSIEVVPGTYEVMETPTQGWDLTGITCDDSTSDTPSTSNGATATFNVDPGETVTCTFTNTKRGTIHIVKDAVPNNAQDFAFGGDLGGFILDDDAEAAGEDTDNDREEFFTGLLPGTYTVSESAAAGWDLTDLTCSDPDGGSTVAEGDSEATIDLDPGETVTCTFTNTKRDAIEIVKQTDPEQDPRTSHSRRPERDSKTSPSTSTRTDLG